MSRTVVVEVTADDIKRGEPGSCYTCPVALALERAGFKYPMVLPGDAIFWGSEKQGRQAFNTPDHVTRFARLFDRDRVGEPFTFTVELP